MQRGGEMGRHSAFTTVLQFEEEGGEAGETGIIINGHVMWGVGGGKEKRTQNEGTPTPSSNIGQALTNPRLPQK